MTFLNSAILAALTLGLLPILIHLLNRQRFKKLDFPTLRFLRELQRQKMRQVRLRQILLLILRTLAVVFLVLALARPVVRSTAGFVPGVAARTTAVLVMDRSASMQTETASGSRFRLAQLRAQEILTSLSEGDEAQLIWADAEPEPFPDRPTADRELLRQTIGNAKPTSRGGDLTKALRAARHTLGHSQNLHKEVYLLSDFSVSAWPEQMPAEELLPPDVRLFLIPVGGAAANVGITHAAVTSRLITPGRTVEVTCDVRNAGSAAVTDRIFSVYVSGRRVAQTRTTLPAGETKVLQFRFVPDETGDQAGYVRVEDADDLAADDVRHFVLRVPARLNVAVTGADGAARALTTLALNPAADATGFVQARVLSSEELEREDWTQFDAIVVVDASTFGPSFAPRLRSFVENGKGVLVVAGPRADLRAYARWLPELGLPAPTEIWEAGAVPARWSRVDYGHPIFEGLFAEKPADVSPEINRLIRTTPTETAVEIIGVSDDKPFLLEAKAGRGRALLMTGSPDPDWSSLYRSGIFAPLLVSSAAYLSGIGTSGDEFQFTAGMPAELRFAGTAGQERFELRGPQTVAPAIETMPSGYSLKFGALEETGTYALFQGNRRVATVVVNIPGRESLVAPAAEEYYRPHLGGRIKTLDERSVVQTAIQESRYGRELWKACLGLALLFLVAEMLIARVSRREAVT